MTAKLPLVAVPHLVVSLRRARRMTKWLILFVLVAALLLPIGYVGAQMLWHRFHHRYDSPQTGLYHGHVSVLFDNYDEPFYWLHFRAESSPRWYWRQPSRFRYSRLEVEWREESTERRATVSLPAFTYRTDSASGPFTRDVLASWLNGGATNKIFDRQRADTIFGYFEAAAGGSLPRPRHHTYYFEQPIRVRVQHFLFGYGVGSTVYIWFVVWLLSVVLVGRKILRRSHGG